MPPKYIPVSGSKAANIKVPCSVSNASVRGIPNPSKGSNNPSHFHVQLPKGFGKSK
jgi:hypothetical protein